VNQLDKGDEPARGKTAKGRKSHNSNLLPVRLVLAEQRFVTPSDFRNTDT